MNQGSRQKGWGWSMAWLVLLLVVGCSPGRHLGPGEKLFVDAKIDFEKPNALQHKKILREQLQTLIRPVPNSSFRLWVYNLWKEPKKSKGLKYWLKYKLGEPPVLYDHQKAERSRLILEKYVQDEGYLTARVRLDSLHKKFSIQPTFTVQAPKRYRIAHIHWPDGGEVLDSLAWQFREDLPLEEGDIYQTEKLRSTRKLLTDQIRQLGYYGLTQEDLYYYVDTSQLADSVDIYVRWKPSEDSSKIRPYRLGVTRIHPVHDAASTSPTDTILYNGLYLIENEFFLHEKLLAKAIRGRQGDLYNSRLQSSSIRYLDDLDVYRFINVQTAIRSDSSGQYLDRAFYLSPRIVRDVRFDFEANTRSGSYLGILSAVNFTNRNWLGGAERLNVGISVGGETQFGVGNNLFNTLEESVQASVSLPDLLLPIPDRFRKLYRDYVARTRFSLSNVFQQRTQLYAVNRFSASMTYDWKSKRRVHHQLSPVYWENNLTFNISDAFQEELDENVRLANSLSNVMIPGGQYRLSSSNQQLGQAKPYWALNAQLELAGHLAYGVARLSRPNRAAAYELLGLPFSQYTRLNVDGKYHLQRAKHSWVFRFNGGFIGAYGNSTVAPISKQFSVGGSNSMRTFRFRQLGPGNYFDPDEDDQITFEQTGDIKLEANLEYRQSLGTYFEVAAFVDAGNVWLLNQSLGEDKQGQFLADRFANEIAVGSGFGLRLNLSFFVIRYDFGWPLHQPSVDGRFEWNWDRLDFWNNSWLFRNMVGNFAIGYPF
ncbi:MAG: BamA/TamA family outer membrane protein [Bacteroidota bacterium]